jgi:hypothetical protein
MGNQDGKKLLIGFDLNIGPFVMRYIPYEIQHFLFRTDTGKEGFTEVMVGLAERHGRPRGGDHVRASRGLPGL